MGLFRLFKIIDERDDEVVFRDNTGFHILPLTMIGAGLIIFVGTASDGFFERKRRGGIGVSAGGR